MSKLARFLEQLADFEMAFLYTFRRDNYLPYSQNLIDLEISKRKLSLIDIDRLINQKINEEPVKSRLKWQCSNCKSSHYYEKKEEIERAFDNSKANIFNSIFDSHPKKIYKDVKTCIICGKSDD